MSEIRVNLSLSNQQDFSLGVHRVLNLIEIIGIFDNRFKLLWFQILIQSTNLVLLLQMIIFSSVEISLTGKDSGIDPLSPEIFSRTVTNSLGLGLDGSDSEFFHG